MTGAEQLLAYTWSQGQRAIWEVVPPDDHQAVREQLCAGVRALQVDGFLPHFSQDPRVRP